MRKETLIKLEGIEPIHTFDKYPGSVTPEPHYVYEFDSEQHFQDVRMLSHELFVLKNKLRTAENQLKVLTESNRTIKGNGGRYQNTRDMQYTGD